ncbi:MAG: Peptidyl-prolyl cis-trans isomerase D [Myxococcota bacterium]|nr:Peptidyl-prolyl cis-trans isomerase D [Myxococcota bacterium]
MLDKLRQNKSHSVFILFFSILILFFIINFGPGNVGESGCSGSGLQISVNGEQVSTRDFKYIQQTTRRRDSDALNPQIAALNAIIDESVLYGLAREYNILTPQKVQEESIVTDPAFQKNGKFDFEYYQKLLTNGLGVDRGYFEARRARELTANAMRIAARAGVHISYEELAARYRFFNEKISVEYIAVDPETAAKGMTPDPAEIAKFTTEKKADIEKYYNDNKTDFVQPETARIRHLLIAVEDPDNKAKDAEAKKKAEDLLAKVRAGEDFVELCKQHSEDQSTKDEGGDLGYRSRDGLDKSFAEAAFGASPYIVVGPVRSAFGYHLIRNEGMKPGINKTLEQATGEIAAKLYLRDVAGKQKAREIADGFLKRARAGESLKAIAGADTSATPTADAKPATGYKTASTGEFSRNVTGFIPTIDGVSEDAIKKIFLKKAGELLDEPVEIGGKFYVMKIENRTSVDWTNFNKEKELYVRLLSNGRRENILPAWVESLRGDAKVSHNLTLSQGPVIKLPDGSQPPAAPAN